MSDPVKFRTFTASGNFGFGCKIWLARVLEEDYFEGNHYVWFSRELNPVLPTGISSNPLHLYLQLDTAVKSGDRNLAKIKDLRASLLQAIGLLVAPKDPPLARRMKRAVIHAPLEMYRPQLWRLNLDKISGRCVQGLEGWDEWTIDQLRATEFETIVE